MFWSKKSPAKANKVKRDSSLIKPSPRREVQREKRIELKVPCYILVEDEDFLLQTTTINISRTGLLVRALDPIKTGKEIKCLLSSKTNLTKPLVQASKYVMKGKIVRVEKDELIYKIAIQITLGRVDPSAFLEGANFAKHWWTRHWQ